MRRLVTLALVSAFAFTFVGTPMTRAATIASSWSVGSAPFGLALDSTNGKIYVANSETTMLDGTGRISVVDPATGSVGTLLTSLTSSFVLADSSARRLYSSNASPSGASVSTDVFDLDNGTTVASIPGVGGSGLALDATAGRLFAGGHELNLIDTTTNAPVGTPLAAPSGGAWFGVAVDPGLKRLYLADANASAPKLFVYDYDSEDVLTAATPGTVALGTAIRLGVAVDPVRHLIFAAGSDTTGGSASVFYVIAGDTLQVLHTTALSGFPMGIVLGPSANQIYVSVTTSGTAGRIYVLDGATFAVTDVIPLSTFAPGPPLLHTDGRLYVADYSRLNGQNSSLLALESYDHAPVFQSFSLTPSSSATTRQTLQVEATATDSDLRAMGAPDPTAFSYEWFRNGTLIPGANASSLDLRIEGNGDRGDRIVVRVTASDGRRSSIQTATLDVVNTGPSATVSLSSSSPKTNEVLTASAIGADDDGDVLAYTYTWRVNGVVKRAATTTNATDTFDLKAKGNGGKGDVVTVTVTAFDGAASSAAAAASATIR